MTDLALKNQIFDKLSEMLIDAGLAKASDSVFADAAADAILELLKGAVKPLDEWTEEDGDVLWWCWDGNDWLREAPYVGSPLDLGQTVECHTHRETGEKPAARFQVGGWPGYHTHWAPLPAFPQAPALAALGVK